MRSGSGVHQTTLTPPLLKRTTAKIKAQVTVPTILSVVSESGKLLVEKETTMKENKNVTAVQNVRFGVIEQFFRKDLHFPKGVDMRLHGALKWSVVIVTVLATIALVQPRTARAADVTACVQRSTGDLRLVNSANECRLGE